MDYDTATLELGVGSKLLPFDNLFLLARFQLLKVLELPPNNASIPGTNGQRVDFEDASDVGVNSQLFLWVTRILSIQARPSQLWLPQSLTWLLSIIYGKDHFQVKMIAGLQFSHGCWLNCESPRLET